MPDRSAKGKMLERLCRRQVIDAAIEAFEHDVAENAETFSEMLHALTRLTQSAGLRPEHEETQRFIHSQALGRMNRLRELALADFVSRQVQDFDCVTREDVLEETLRQLTLSAVKLSLRFPKSTKVARPAESNEDEDSDTLYPTAAEKLGELQLTLRSIAFGLYARVAVGRFQMPALRSLGPPSGLPQFSVKLYSTGGMLFELDLEYDVLDEEAFTREGLAFVAPQLVDCVFASVASEEMSTRRLEKQCQEVIRVLQQLTPILHSPRTRWSILSRLEESLESTAPDFIWKSAMEALFPPPSVGKHDLLAALRRGTELASEVARIESRTLALILAVSAIETILSTGSANVTKDLARRSAALVASQASERTKWIKFFEQLYNTRSGIVHGRATQCSEEDLTNAALDDGGLPRSVLPIAIHAFVIRHRRSAASGSLLPPA